MELSCPLCQNMSDKDILPGPDKRRFYICSECRLIFADPSARISEEDEKFRYTLHENSLKNEGYVEFLNQILQPALDYIDFSMIGLDFGCGPHPALSVLLQQKGIQCDNYDPFFFPTIQNRKYDFIFATECFEHFNNPESELNKISGLLNESGYLFILTSKWTTPELFATWTYARDITHVSFYHDSTFEFIADKYGYGMIGRENPRIIILKKR